MISPSNLVSLIKQGLGCRSSLTLPPLDYHTMACHAI